MPAERSDPTVDTGEPRRRAEKRWGWPVVVLVVVLGFVFWHAAAMDHYLQRVTAEKFTVSPMDLPRQQVPLGTAFDAQTWVRLAGGLEAGPDWRLRTDVFENAPEGRPVFWNSAWAWWLIGAGKLWSSVFGGGFLNGLERSAVWANLPVLVLLTLGLWIWISRRWSAGLGAVMAAVMVGHRGFYAGFYPGNPDHHGIITACGAGMVLGVALAGAGWHRTGANSARDGWDWWARDEASAKRAMMISAIFGAVGMWFSAASIIPVFAALSVALMMSGKPAGTGLAFSGKVWRHWGRWGGALCLGFYLLEQFPDRLGWRLEINHPVYALAWVAGAELLAWYSEARLRASFKPTRTELGVLTMSLMALVLPIMIIGVGRESVFGLLDPVLKRIHAHVTELESLPTRVGALGWMHYFSYVVLEPAFLVLTGVVAWRARRTGEGFLLRMVWWVTVLLLVLAWWQNRWMLMAGGPLAVLAAVFWGRISGDSKSGKTSLVAAGIVIVVLAGWHPWQLVTERLEVSRRGDVQSEEARQLLYRDVARVLRADAAGREVILLAAPDASTAVSYFGDFSSLGTLYWENRSGLSRAERLLGAKHVEEAALLVRRWGVTHLALFGFDGGGLIYSPDGDAPTSVGPRLLAGDLDPVWLRPIIYELPPQFGRIESRVRLFAVDFTQSEAEAAYRHGLAAVAFGENDRALRCFSRATRTAPNMPAPWLRLAEVQLRLRSAKAAMAAMISGIQTLPLAEQETAYLDAAKLFGAQGATAEGNQLLDKAIAVGRSQ